MNTRLVAVAALTVSGIGFSTLGVGSDPARREIGKDIQLLQGQIGEYRRTDQYWLNEPAPGTIEEGAMYSAATGVPAQLDFFRRGLRPHNGIGCYLLQGETLLWERLQRLPTLNGSAEFDLGLTQTRESLRLVAASDCRAGGCTEVPLPVWQFSDFKRLIPQLFNNPSEAVVPVSVVLTVSATRRDPALEADLIRQLQNFIAGLDLEPARKLATLQGNLNSDSRDAVVAPVRVATKIGVAE